MSNSALVDYVKLSPNCNSPRNHEIDTITIHCVCGQLSVEALGDLFAKPERQASSNYGIGSDGRVGMYCEEKNRSWCSSSPSNDHRAITIECASDKTKPYAVNDKVFAKLIDLCVDIVKRNPGFKGSLRWKADKSLIGQPDKQNMTVHRWYSNTSCPGDYLYSRMGQIADEVNKRLINADPVTSKFVAGDIVYFVGGMDHSSSQDKGEGTRKGKSLARVTKVAPGAKYPYHCRRIDCKGKYISGGVYGWVSEDTMTT